MRGALYHLMTTQATDYFLMLLVLLSCVEVRGEQGAAGRGVQRADCGSLGCSRGMARLAWFASSLWPAPSLLPFNMQRLPPLATSLLQMAMETSSMDPAARRTHVLHWIDVGTTIAFALEALLKIVAFGFRPYFAFNSNKVGCSWRCLLVGASPPHSLPWASAID